MVLSNLNLTLFGELGKFLDSSVEEARIFIKMKIHCQMPLQNSSVPILAMKLRTWCLDRPDTMSVISFSYALFLSFTDDTNLYFEADKFGELQKVLNKELVKVEQWLDANRLSLNIERTNLIIFTSKKHPVADNLIVNQIVI